MLNFQEYQRLDEKIDMNAYARKYMSGFTKAIERFLADNKITPQELANASKDARIMGNIKQSVLLSAEKTLKRQLMAIFNALVTDELEKREERQYPNIYVEINFPESDKYVTAQIIASRKRRTNNLSKLGIKISLPYHSLVGALLAASRPTSRKPKELAHDIYSSTIHELTHVVQILRRDNTVKDRVQNDTFEYGGAFTDEFRQDANYLARDREIEAHAVGAVREIQNSRASLRYLFDNVRDKKTLQSYAGVSDSFRSYYEYFGPESMGSRVREGRKVWQRFLKKFFQHALDVLDDA